MEYFRFKHVYNAIFAMVAVTIFGTIGFYYTEHLHLFDAFWLTVITVLTVGYGDAVPESTAGKLFALVIIPLGIGIVSYATGAIATVMIEGELTKTFAKRRMSRVISKLENHVIVCGHGRVGEQVLEQLIHTETPTVVIDIEELELPVNLPKYIHYIVGNATDDEVLKSAGIEKASGLVTTLPTDADNVFVTLTAKGMNENIKVIARAEKLQTEDKLIRAGAARVINPSSIGGKQMVFSILKPVSVDYVNAMLHAGKRSYGIEEVKLVKDSPFINKTIGELRIRSEYGVMVLAIVREEEMNSNPEPEEKLLENDIIVIFGSDKELKEFEKEAQAM
ncbi:voltage-gated potassium channel [Peribacillus deserti]|uniref:Voltage-gated potassium channel n=1 Tax=Peribacillus deserti TaxID=673318 RepID=A0ABS2QBW8_9BACI|nr:potassium channel protein [Peribacillus deserti]MBM7690624.1 voltage-gated potassium channel [Peribacillus deserti]